MRKKTLDSILIGHAVRLGVAAIVDPVGTRRWAQRKARDLLGARVKKQTTRQPPVRRMKEINPRPEGYE